jgi:2-dehydropantoate 2-reductase
MSSPDQPPVTTLGPRPHIAIIGIGAIGSMLAAHLTEAGHDVTCVDGWYPHVEAARTVGVQISSPDEQHRVRIVAHHVDEVDHIDRPVDLLLVAVKAYDSAWAIRLMEPLLHPSTVVVPVQNGMTDAWFGSLAAGRRRLGCSVHVPAELTAPGRVTRYLPRSRRTLSVGEVHGGGSDLADEVTSLLAAAGGCETTEDLVAVKWAKLAVNTMTNAPAGISRWTTRRLWSDPRSASLAARAAGETLAVARAGGVTPAPVYGRYDPAVFIHGLRDPGAAEEARAALGEMAAERVGSSESRPSLLQDVDRGRRTEVRYLNGFVADRGRTYGVRTPANDALTDLVEQIDRGGLAPRPENLDRCNDSINLAS